MTSVILLALLFHSTAYPSNKRTSWGRILIGNHLASGWTLILPNVDVHQRVTY